MKGKFKFTRFLSINIRSLTFLSSLFPMKSYRPGQDSTPHIKNIQHAPYVYDPNSSSAALFNPQSIKMGLFNSHVNKFSNFIAYPNNINYINSNFNSAAINIKQISTISIPESFNNLISDFENNSLSIDRVNIIKDIITKNSDLDNCINSFYDTVQESLDAMSFHKEKSDALIFVNKGNSFCHYYMFNNTRDLYFKYPSFFSDNNSSEETKRNFINLICIIGLKKIKEFIEDFNTNHKNNFKDDFNYILDELNSSELGKLQGPMEIDNFNSIVFVIHKILNNHLSDEMLKEIIGNNSGISGENFKSLVLMMDLFQNYYDFIIKNVFPKVTSEYDQSIIMINIQNEMENLVKQESFPNKERILEILFSDRFKENVFNDNICLVNNDDFTKYLEGQKNERNCHARIIAKKLSSNENIMNKITNMIEKIQQEQKEKKKLLFSIRKGSTLDTRNTINKIKSFLEENNEKIALLQQYLAQAREFDRFLIKSNINPIITEELLTNSISTGEIYFKSDYLNREEDTYTYYDLSIIKKLIEKKNSVTTDSKKKGILNTFSKMIKKENSKNNLDSTGKRIKDNIDKIASEKNTSAIYKLMKANDQSYLTKDKHKKTVNMIKELPVINNNYLLEGKINLILPIQDNSEKISEFITSILFPIGSSRIIEIQKYIDNISKEKSTLKHNTISSIMDKIAAFSYEVDRMCDMSPDTYSYIQLKNEIGFAKSINWKNHLEQKDGKYILKTNNQQFASYLKDLFSNMMDQKYNKKYINVVNQKYQLNLGERKIDLILYGVYPKNTFQKIIFNSNKGIKKSYLGTEKLGGIIDGADKYMKLSDDKSSPETKVETKKEKEKKLKEGIEQKNKAEEAKEEIEKEGKEEIKQKKKEEAKEETEEEDNCDFNSSSSSSDESSSEDEKY